MPAAAARYAIYYVPDPDEPLWHFGRQVLGYDSYSGDDVPRPRELSSAFPCWARHVEGPARYGFHATLKAPFRLREGKSEQDLMTALQMLAQSLPAASLGFLAPVALGHFIALRPVAHPPGLEELESGIVMSLESLRAPLSEAERTRREPHRLTMRQRILLEQYGYPFCLDEFRFHMTLAGPFDSTTQERALSVLRGLFQSFDQPCRLESVAVARQLSPEQQFRVIGRFPLAGIERVGDFNTSFILSHR